jgi:hypothetical protein
MKIRLFKKNAASSMVSVAILAVFIAGMIATYLLMVTNEYSAVARSETWNGALHVAEAGADEALQAINKNMNLLGKVATWTNSVVGSDGWDTSASYKTNITWTVNGVVKSWEATNGTVYHVGRA